MYIGEREAHPAYLDHFEVFKIKIEMPAHSLIIDS